MIAYSPAVSPASLVNVISAGSSPSKKPSYVAENAGSSTVPTFFSAFATLIVAAFGSITYVLPVMFNA